METTRTAGQSETALELADRISEWLRQQLERSGAARFVLGLSGGIDSAVVAGLAARGVGSDRVLGVMMPSSSNPNDHEAARLVAEAFQIPTITVDLTDATTGLRAVLPTPDDVGTMLGLDAPITAASEQLANANLKPRLRMTTLYYIANLVGGMVLGTGNRSEAMIGYFTKYGDGGVDLKPISNLYKREVRAVARAIGVPAPVIERPPSAGLWEGQTDEDEIGITYDELDRALDALKSGATTDIPDDVLARVRGMVERSAHKRKPVPEFER
jgi:NAD+ synthase